MKAMRKASFPQGHPHHPLLNLARGEFIRLVAKAAMLTALIMICQTPASAFAQDRPCMPDMAKLCPNVQRGGGRMIDCLIAHQESVSPACKEHLAEVKKKVNEARKVCQDDIEIFCSDVKSGTGRVVKCLKDNITELSVECQEKLRR